jgi:hypothetical protein
LQFFAPGEILAPEQTLSFLRRKVARPRGQNPLTQESRFDSRLQIRGGSLEPRRSDGGRVAYFEGLVAG